MSLWTKIKAAKDHLEAKVSERRRRPKGSEKHLLALPREIREAGQAVQGFCTALKIQPEIVFCSNGYGWPPAPGGLLYLEGEGRYEVLVHVRAESEEVQTKIDLLDRGSLVGSQSGFGSSLLEAVEGAAGKWHSLMGGE
jgi:hypothetical protein